MTDSQLSIFDQPTSEPESISFAPAVMESYNRLILATMLLNTPEGRKVPAPDIAVPSGLTEVERTDVRAGDFVIADQSRLGYGSYPWPVAGYVQKVQQPDQHHDLRAEISDVVPGLGKPHTIQLPMDVVAVYRDLSA